MMTHYVGDDCPGGHQEDTMTDITPRPLSDLDREYITETVAEHAPNWIWTGLYAALLHAEGERDEARQRAAELASVLRENERLRTGIRSLADRPVLREANPYSEIADIQMRAERLLEEPQ